MFLAICLQILIDLKTLSAIVFKPIYNENKNVFFKNPPGSTTIIA